MTNYIRISSGSLDPNHASTIATHFWNNVLLFPRDNAFSYIHDTSISHLTWCSIAARVFAICEVLASNKLEPGEHVASWLQNSIDWIALDFACQTLGLVHVAIDHRESESRVIDFVKFSQSRLLVSINSEPATPELLFEIPSNSLHTKVQNRLSCSILEIAHGQPPVCSKVSQLRMQASSVDPQKPAQMLFTSGTISKPKGVMLSHANLLSNALAKLKAAPQFVDDLRLNLLPFSHAYARTCELTTWVLSRSRLAIVVDWSELLLAAPLFQPTLLNLVPILARRAAESLSTDRGALGVKLRLLQVGGAALGEDLWRTLGGYSLPPLQGYGLTEASPVVCSNRAGGQRCSTVGPAVDGVELRLAADGELQVRGPGTMLGYWNDTAATEQILNDGWLSTGDLATIDEEGYVHIVGRKSIRIVLDSGYKVDPAQIEQKLQTDPLIQQAILVGDGRPFLAVMIYSNDCRCERELLRTVSTLLSDLPQYMRPRRIFVLPKPLSQTDDTLTAKGSPRRSIIMAAYRREIDELYSSKLPK
ncbi:MAG: AMP-binding protein [Planctomycetales bacterium]|nr:AMP-binding protein [Planctomycetales bacterium]